MAKAFKRKPNYMLIIGIVLLIAIILWNYYASWLVGQLSLTPVRQGWVDHEKEVQAVFANTETIITAPAEGKVISSEEDGRRYKKGETVARIVPSGVDHGQAKEEVIVTAPISGLFYHKWDNLEQVITPENLMNMDLNALIDQVKTTQRPSVENDVQKKNAPLGKMVNNLYPSWMFVYLGDTDVVAKGETVRFRIEEEEYAGTVMKLSGQPRGAIVRFPQYVKGTTENRVQKVVWIFKPPTKGMLIPKGSLYTLGEERGVYIGDDGFIRFLNLRILDSNEKFACVEGLPEGVEVITNPREGIEGLTLKKRI